MRALIATLLAVTTALAQDAPKELPTFKVTTQLVTVNVSALDRQGNPLPNLKASDFVLTEDGKKQKIAVFEFQKLDDTPLPALPETRPDRTAKPAAAQAPPPLSETRPDRKAKPAAAPAPPPPARPIEAGKPGEVKYKDRRLLVLYFDMSGMAIGDQIRAQESALKFLQTQITAADTIAVMSFTSRLNLIQDFTSSRDALLQAVNGLVMGDTAGMAEEGATADDDSQSNTGAAYTADDTEFNIFSTDRKLVALQSAVKTLGALPEKKALIYYSSGIKKTGTNNEAQMRAATNAAIRANVSLYPVDARGLVAFGPGGDSAKGAAGGNRAMTGALALGAVASLRASQETLHTLAVDTGGRELVDSNDLSQGVVQAQKGVGSYYIVGYYSSNPALDGQYRRIKLQHSDRTVKLDYRPGYFAGKQFKQFTASDRERQLQEALLLGDPMTELPLAMEVNYFRLDEHRYFVPVQVKLPGSEIEVARHGGADTARLDFVGQVRDGAGKVLRSVRDNLEIRLKGVTAAELATKSLSYDTGFSLAPGKYSIKFLARENASGKMGTFETTFVVPNLGGERKELAISSVVLSNQLQAQGDTVASGEQNKKALGEHPLIRDGKKLIPSVTRAFRNGQTLYVYLETYQAAAEPVQPVEATVALYRGRQKSFEAPLAVMQGGFKAKSKALPVWFAVPLKGLDPGQYTCQVSVLNPAAQKVAFWRAPIALLP